MKLINLANNYLLLLVLLILCLASEVLLDTISRTLANHPKLHNVFYSSSEETDDCIPSQTVSRNNEFCIGDLIFEENFDNLRNNIWQRDIRIPMESKGAEFLSYQNYPENCYVQNGKLIILPKLITDFPGFDRFSVRSGTLDFGTNCTGINDNECHRTAGNQFILPPVVSCKLTTKSSFSFKYGKIEIRAKFPKGDWIFPELLLEPVNNEYGSNGYASGQMRIGFIRGNEILFTKDYENINGKQLFGGVILSNDQRIRNKWMKSIIKEEHLGDDFHTYTLTWKNDSISVALDGNIYWHFGPTFKRQARQNNISDAFKWIHQGGLMAPFDKEFYISLGVAVGGVFDFPDYCRNGLNQLPKPWRNTDPKSELHFWLKRNNWYPTWNGLHEAMQIDSIKVWAV